MSSIRSIITVFSSGMYTSNQFTQLVCYYLLDDWLCFGRTIIPVKFQQKQITRSTSGIVRKLGLLGHPPIPTKKQHV